MRKVEWKIIIGGIVLFALGMATAWAGPLTFKSETTFAQPVYNEDTVTSIYDKASPAVVEINVTQGIGTRGGFSVSGEGSGFLVSNNGSILTNNHVVDGASKITVTFKDGSTASANVIGTDSVHDVALIKVDAAAVSGITPLTLGNSTLVRPGQLAVAIGSPFGLDSTITVGIISGVNRNVNGGSLTGMLQTDAALNPGNSGGPLLNSNGEVVGINTAVETGARGIGFAVPSNVVRSVLPALSAGKQVQRVWLGISGIALNADLATQLGLSVNQGAYVVGVFSGSPAEKAGLKGAGGNATGGVPAPGGDVIAAVDGVSAKSVSDLSNYINLKQVGDQVTLTVIRGGNTLSVKVTLEARPSNPSVNVLPTPHP